MEKAEIIKNGNLNLQPLSQESKDALIHLMRTTGLMPLDTEKNFNRFFLTESEQKAFDESGSTNIQFETGSGIGVKVSYLNAVGVWVDITDYSTW